MPSFEGTVDDQTYAVGEPIVSLTLLGATGGNGALAFSLAPELPPGLRFDGEART